MGAYLDATSVPQAVKAGRHVGELSNGLLPGEGLVIADALQKAGCVDRSAHHVEMGAGVAPAYDRPRVQPGLGPEAPVLVVQLGHRRSEAGPEPVGDHCVKQSVEGILSALHGNVAHASPLERRVRRVEGLCELELAPVGQIAEHPRLGRGRSLGQPLAHSRVGQRFQAVGDRERHGGTPIGETVQDGAGKERQPDGHGLGQGQGDYPRSLFRGPAGRF